jgi:methyl-accepting chemotaxis protein
MSNMTIGKRLMIGFGATLLVALGMAVSGIYWINDLSRQVDDVASKTGKKVFMMSEMQADLFRVRSCQRGVMLFSMYKLREKAESNKQEAEQRMGMAEQSLREVKPLLVTEEGRRLAVEMETNLSDFKSYFEQVAAASLADRHEEALRVYSEHTGKSLDALETAATRLLGLQKQVMDKSAADSFAAASKARWISIILTIVALVICPFVVRAIQHTTRDLRRAATDLADGSAQIASAAAQVASSSGSLAQGASEQAASLEETSASAEEITSMTRKNAENSKTAAEMMAAVDQHVQDGNRTLEEMVRSMTEISASSEKISKIIKVIDEIAFQTNILALNAAVEAARAGEAGMGFAVVADEVRNLAQRSAQAAKDTASMIEESISKSNGGSAKLQKVTDVIHAITESSTKVKTLVDEVNLGSQEQARGIEQISKAVAQMDRVTQTTAASAEESASASEELSAQAEALKSIVVDLQTLVGKAARTGSLAMSRKPAEIAKPAPPPVKITPMKVAAKAPVFKAEKANFDSFPMDDSFVEQ